MAAFSFFDFLMQKGPRKGPMADVSPLLKNFMLMAQWRLAADARSASKQRVCNKSFSSSQAFKYHVKIHTRDKLHECKTCKKTFKRQMALKFHEAIHAELPIDTSTVV